MPEAYYTLHHEKRFIRRLPPRLLPGYRAGLQLRWYAPGAERRGLTLEERLELLSALRAREMALQSAGAARGAV